MHLSLPRSSSVSSSSGLSPKSLNDDRDGTFRNLNKSKMLSCVVTSSNYSPLHSLFGQLLGVQLVDAVLLALRDAVRRLRLVDLHVPVVLVDGMERLQYVQLVEFGAFAMTM